MKKSRFAEEQIAGGILLDHQTGDNTTALRAYLISHVLLADEDARIDDLRQQVVPIAAVRVCQVHAERDNPADSVAHTATHQSAR